MEFPVFHSAHNRLALRIVATLALGGLLAACGYKGPLYLPPPEPGQPAPTGQQTPPPLHPPLLRPCHDRRFRPARPGWLAPFPLPERRAARRRRAARQPGRPVGHAAVRLFPRRAALGLGDLS
ncbi:LPS translocon maturation chaperone LptM [Bordetella parapertussis]|uniref:LPS translocon maturation chaperone LptM n=1 Tax=Bordetella parapertussis TaxID=519 RepID=UPI001F616F7B|nr:lipoprotein [Bordetella parapertussis]